MNLHPNLHRTACLGLALLAWSGVNGKADAIVPVFQDETATYPGATTNDYTFGVATSLSSDNYPNATYGSVGTATAWPAAITADGGNTAETFNHTNASDTTDFLDASSNGGGIYAFFSETAFQIAQTAPLASMNTLSFQLYMAAGSDAAAINNEYMALPTLTLTLSDNSQVVLTSGAGVTLSSNSATIFGMSTTLDDIGFTFDTSAYSDSIASYTLSWSVAEHSITYGADVTEIAAVATPEPSTWALMILGLAGLVFYQRVRRQRAQVG